MRGRSRIFQLLFAPLALAALTLLTASDAIAQCPLCRTALEHGGDAAARTMNIAILVLLIPPVSLFCSIFAIAYRKRKGDEDEQSRERWRANSRQ
jgi:heme/copper-type cytochrome/quinol oxidase subunit 2